MTRDRTTGVDSAAPTVANEGLVASPDEAPCELEELIAEFSGEHPWLWRRTLLRSWSDRQIGRLLPWLCRHRTSVGPVDGPMTCMDCGRGVPGDN